MAHVSIAELPWWDLAEVADADARIFGATAWTIQYYWAVLAQPGTAMFAARLGGSDEPFAPYQAAATRGAKGSDPAPGTAPPDTAPPDTAPPGTAPPTPGAPASGDLAGWVVMSALGSEADVMTIATTEAARGTGVGRTLLTVGLEWAADQGSEVVHLEVDEHNEPALGLYRSLGFREWGRRPDYYPGADAILMRRSAR